MLWWSVVLLLLRLWVYLVSYLCHEQALEDLGHLVVWSASLAAVRIVSSWGSKRIVATNAAKNNCVRIGRVLDPSYDPKSAVFYLSK